MWNSKRAKHIDRSGRERKLGEFGKRGSKAEVRSKVNCQGNSHCFQVYFSSVFECFNALICSSRFCPQLCLSSS